MISGCQMNESDTIPDNTLHIPHNVAEQIEPRDVPKKQLPPIKSNSRTIDYNGHGLGYNGYHVDQFHRKYYQDSGISPH